MKRFAQNNKQLLIMIGVIVVIFGILAVTVNNFATARNLTNLLTQVAPIALMASGVTFVLITAGMDISCPSVMAASAVVGVYYMTQVPNASYVLGTVIVLLVGAFLGLINGFAIAKLKMVPLVVTLSMMTVGTGLATILSGTSGLPVLDGRFAAFFNKTTIIILLLFVVFALDYILTKTAYGRKIYYIGNNTNTTKISGINNVGITITAYVISGACAGLAGIVNIASISTARASMGPQSQILDIFSAAIIGGVSPDGGKGRVRDALLGAILIVGLNNVMNLLGVNDYYTTLIKGLIIIGAMGISASKKRVDAKKGA